jgi:hypothetical protein
VEPAVTSVCTAAAAAHTWLHAVAPPKPGRSSAAAPMGAAACGCPSPARLHRAGPEPRRKKKSGVGLHFTPQHERAAQLLVAAQDPRAAHGHGNVVVHSGGGQPQHGDGPRRW